MKMRIGYTNKYLDIGSSPTSEEMYDAAKYLKEDIKEGTLECSYCKKKIKKDDEIIIIHNPPDESLPIRVHFFCLSKGCAKTWSLLPQEKRMYGDF